MTEAEPSGNGTQAIDRALDVLEVLKLHPNGLTPAEVAELTGLSRPTAHRILSAFQRRGYTRSAQGHGRYRLGFRVVELSSSLLGDLELRRESQPHLSGLVALVEETVHLTVLDAGEIIYVDKVESPRQSIRMASRVGGRAPVHCTASGKAILSWIPEVEVRAVLALHPMERRTKRTITDPEELLRHLQIVREQGYAVDDVENEEGVYCLAAPIFGHNGQVLGAISISGPEFRATPERLNRTIPALMEHTRLISRAMGWRGGARRDR